MLKKVADNLGYVGALALFAGLVLYSLNKDWSLRTQVLVFGGLVLLVVYLAVHFQSLVGALRSRGGRQGSAAGAGVVLFIGILALVNFLNYRHHQRVDLSEGALHSLSDQSRKIVGSLSTDLNVIGFFVESGAANAFENLMKEYRFASSRVQYEVVDPQEDFSRANQYDIDRPSQIVIQLGSKTQKVESTTEEAITNAIIKITRDFEKVVYFLEGHKEHDLNSSEEDGYQAVRNAVEKQNYVVKTINLGIESAFPDDMTVLVVAGPERSFLPHEVQAIEGFLEKGGKLLLMTDPQTDFQGEFLSAFGIRLEDNVVIDVNPLGQLLNLGPAAPLVASYSSHPITENLEVTTFFPLVRSLEIVDSPLGYQVQELFASSGASWGETQVVEGQEVAFDEGVDKEGPLPLALVATLAHEVPEENADPDEEPGEADDQNEEASESGDDPPPPKLESRIVVVGDSDFISNRFLNVGGANADLFLNMVSWLAEDTDLVAIRPKDPTSRQVTLTERDSRLLFWGSVILLPLATLVLGVSIWMRRR